jgi:hypothetical protein
MKISSIIIGLAVIVTTGCQHPVPSTRFNNVHLGMSEAEVIKIVGEPVSMAENKDGSKTLFYNACESRIADQYAPYFVKLVDGKVDSYGRESGATTSKTTPVITPVPVIR